MDENNMNEHIMQIIGSQLLLLIMQTIKFNDENMLIIVIRPIGVFASFACQPFCMDHLLANRTALLFGVWCFEFSA